MGQGKAGGGKGETVGVGGTTQGDPAGEPSGGGDQGGVGGWIKAGSEENKPELLSSQSDGDVGKKPQ